jgi:hypothetical protein
MRAESVAIIPNCTECGERWLPGDPSRWHAYLACDEDLEEPAELFFYCPDCAEREFGSS